MKEFGAWFCAQGQREGGGITKMSAPPATSNFVCPIGALIADLNEYARNLYPMDEDIPRSQFLSEVRRILELPKLPVMYASSPLWQHAHRVQQILSSPIPLGRV